MYIYKICIKFIYIFQKKLSGDRYFECLKSE